MGIRKHKPTTPGRRGSSVADFVEVTKKTPEKALLAPSPKKGGRNVHGRITTRHQGGGHKQRYRIVDFRRTKDGVPAKVAAIEYDPNRTARLALLHYLDGEKRYILAPDPPQGRRHGRVGRGRRHQAGQRPAAEEHPRRHDRPQRRDATGWRSHRCARGSSIWPTWRSRSGSCCSSPRERGRTRRPSPRRTARTRPSFQSTIGSVIHVHDDSPEPLAGEYGTISLPHAWHVLSLVFFAAALGARFLTALVPRELIAGVIWRPVLTAFSVPLLAGIGLLFALIGLLKPEGRGAAKIALFLNATVLLLSGLALWASFRIMPGYGALRPPRPLRPRTLARPARGSSIGRTRPPAFAPGADPGRYGGPGFLSPSPATRISIGRPRSVALAMRSTICC